VLIVDKNGRHFTNMRGLPAAYAAAVTFDDHESQGSDWSVTTLVQPPQLVWLRRKHALDLMEDVGDRVWLLLGTAVHSILERAGKRLAEQGADTLVEHRVETEVLGKRVACVVDVYGDEPATIDDYKVSSSWSVKYGKPRPEWELQLNLEAAILREQGYAVDRLRVIGIFRDWSERLGNSNPDLPQANIEVVEVPVWSRGRAWRVLEERVRMHEAQAEGANVLCSDEDRWAKPKIYAVYRLKSGKRPKKARALFPKLEDAQNEARQIHAEGDKAQIEVRLPSFPRCEKYCPVSEFCEQWNEQQEELAKPPKTFQLRQQ
jgi:hypothetical protein